MRRNLQGLVSAMVESGDVTAVAAAVGDDRRILAEARAGWRDAVRAEPLRRWDRFDLASLTKPWIATLALAVESDLPLMTTVGDLWSDVPAPWRETKLDALLRHRSRLPAWRPFYRLLRSPSGLRERLLAGRERAPIPTYSDLGYQLYALAVERALGEPADRLLASRVCRPLGTATIGVTAGDRPVHTPLGNDREVELARGTGTRVALQGAVPAGVVQDGNARFLGGLPGHAGLFGTVDALWRLGAEWLGPRRLLSRSQVERALGGHGRYRLGWWRRSTAPRATAPLSANAFGHHGFTGCSVWVDPGRQRVFVLLAHRASTTTELDSWRCRFNLLGLSQP